MAIDARSWQGATSTMTYAVIELSGPVQGYTIRRAMLARGNRVYVGTYRDCAAWIANVRAALAAGPAATTLRLLPAIGTSRAS